MIFLLLDILGGLSYFGLDILSENKRPACSQYCDHSWELVRVRYLEKTKNTKQAVHLSTGGIIAATFDLAVIISKHRIIVGHP